MRFIVASVALLSCCSAASAERINIVGVVANYVTARDAVDIEIWLDRAIEPERGEYVTFAGNNQWYGTFAGAQFRFSNRIPQTTTVVDYYSLHTQHRTASQQLLDERIESPIPVTTREMIRDNELMSVIKTSFAADDIGFDRFTPDASGIDRFLFGVSVRYVHNGHIEYDTANGWSTVDAPELIHSPEPSSLVLLGLAHLIWLPSVRKRFREWRVREANRVSG